MKRLHAFWLALILAGLGEGLLVVAAATFAFPYFGADASHDSAFITFSKIAVVVLHALAIAVAKGFPDDSALLFPVIIVANVVFLTVLFWLVIALIRKIRAGASPNGGPGTPVGNSRVAEGPPSVI